MRLILSGKFIFPALLIMLLSACQNGDSKRNLSVVSETKYQLNWIWEDGFEEVEKEKLINWILEVNQSVQNVLGPYLFDMNIHFYKSSNASEPVPWAHTRRSGVQSVHFHVNPDFSLEEFRDDWTAPHEISHIALPFLGKKNSWFAEGFASYMQYQVMNDMKIMTDEQMQNKYKEKIDQNRKYYDSEEAPFIEIARNLVEKSHNYPAMYWGSTSYFILLDQKLQEEKGYGINELVRKYQQNGRNRDVDIEEMILTMDSLIGKPFCKDLYQLFSEEPAKKVFEELKI